MAAYISGITEQESKSTLYETLVGLSCAVRSVFLRESERDHLRETIEILKKAIRRDVDN